MLRLLLVDDEPLALERLRGLLAKVEGVEIAGMAASGAVAVQQVAELRPDALLLDVEMPLLDGFDVVETLQRSGGFAPLIIFVTAYPQFAANAFDTGAIDFLTKPVRLHRLERAIERIRAALEDKRAQERLRELAEQIEDLRAQWSGKPPEGNHLWVHSRGEAIRVDLDRLDLLAAEGEYVRLFIGETSFLHRQSLTALMERLDARRYVRIHRSYAVDRSHVISVKRRATGGYQLLTARGRTLPVGRSYRDAVRAMIGRGNPPSA